MDPEGQKPTLEEWLIREIFAAQYAHERATFDKVLKAMRNGEFRLTEPSR